MSAPEVKRSQLAQAGELYEFMAGEITGAQLVAETASGARFAVVAGRYEATLEHPHGRLILEVSDCVHYSDPVDGCAAWWLEEGAEVAAAPSAGISVDAAVAAAYAAGDITAAYRMRAAVQAALEPGGAEVEE